MSLRLMNERAASMEAERQAEETGTEGPPPPSRRRKWVIALAFVAAVIAVFFSGFDRLLSFSTLIAYQDWLDELVARHTFFAACLFAGIYVLVVTLSLPGALVLTVAGGFLFGGLAGSLLTVSAAALGVAGLYLVARNAFAPFVRARLGEWLEPIDRGLRQGVWSYLFFLRLVPLFPFWAVNLATACLQVPLMPLLVTTFIGTFPATLAYSFAGAAFADAVRTGGAALHNCKGTEQEGCGATFDAATVLSPHLMAFLVIAGLLALLPALIKLRKRRIENSKHTQEMADRSKT